MFSPSQVLLEREKTLEALRENREMENIWTQLRIPKIDVLTLERSVSPEFMKSMYEVVIMLLPQDLTRLGLEISLPNFMIGDHFHANFSPPIQEKESQGVDRIIQPHRKGKVILTKNPSPPKQIMQNFLIWNAKGVNSSEFRRHCMSIISIHKPSILTLLQTRISDHKKLAEELAYHC